MHGHKKIELFAVCALLNGKCVSRMLFFARVEIQRTDETHMLSICFGHTGFTPSTFNLKQTNLQQAKANATSGESCVALKRNTCVSCLSSTDGCPEVGEVVSLKIDCPGQPTCHHKGIFLMGSFFVYIARDCKFVDTNKNVPERFAATGRARQLQSKCLSSFVRNLVSEPTSEGICHKMGRNRNI